MDAARFKELQDDEQREESPDTAIRTFIRSELVDVHTCMPGIVKSFDKKTQTATVQPAIRRLFVGRGFINLPACLDVPVAFPRWGNFVLTGPVSPGDEGLLKFAERAIDFWWDRGGAQEPAEARMHDLSDAFFEPAYSSRGRVPANIADDAVELRTLDGQTLFRLEDAAAIVGMVVGAEKAIKGESYRQAEATKNNGMSAQFTSMASSCTGQLTPLQAGFTALASLVAAFEAGSVAYLAQKAKVG